MDESRVGQLTQLFQAMADPTRLRILGALVDRPRSGQELAGQLRLTPPTISHHMAKLVAAELVTVTPDAQRRLYSLDRQRLRGPLPAEADNPPGPGDGAADIERDQRTEQARTLRSFFDGERLRSIPAQRKKRVVVLRHLLHRFEPGTPYTEREVNDLLRRAHDDVATLRRELVDYGFMTRDKGIYHVATHLPDRSVQIAQETGADEVEWFRSLVTGAVADALATDPPHADSGTS